MVRGQDNNSCLATSVSYGCDMEMIPERRAIILVVEQLDLHSNELVSPRKNLPTACMHADILIQTPTTSIRSIHFQTPCQQV